MTGRHFAVGLYIELSTEELFFLIFFLIDFKYSLKVDLITPDHWNPTEYLQNFVGLDNLTTEELEGLKSKGSKTREMTERGVCSGVCTMPDHLIVCSLHVTMHSKKKKSSLK